MGLKDFFKNRKLKKQQNGSSIANGKPFVKNQTTISDDTLCALWTKCENCKELLYTNDLKKQSGICKHCDYHHRLRAQERIDLLIDYGTFIETDENIITADPLNFVDLKPYKERIKEACKEERKEAILTGIGMTNGFPLAIASMEFNFIGGSMGSVVGEKITRLVERAINKKLPLVIVSSSGGARMHEGILSLMQMAKTSSALQKLHDEKLLFISILTEPTFGGVTASFAMLGDILIAEPKARIGFAGRRVIEETIRQKLPKDFQTAEYLLENGQIDFICHRKNLKNTVSDLIRLHTQNQQLSEKDKKLVQENLLITL